MKFYKQIFYNIRHVIPTIGMAGLTMMPVACAKVDLREESPKKSPEPETPIIQRDTVFEFGLNDVEIVLDMDTLQKYVNSKSIREIYLVPKGHWTALGPNNVSNLRKYLQPRMELSKKMHGYGDFDFNLGAASKVPADSLWYVENGWTINKGHQR